MPHCPTAAAACFIRILEGRSFLFSLFNPTAIAPEETIITGTEAIYDLFTIDLSIVKNHLSFLHYNESR